MYEWMVFNYILQKGSEAIQKITDQDVNNMKKDLDKKEEELKGTNRISLMTPEFQVSLVNDARKICNQSGEEFMKYIKRMSKKIA